MSVYTIRHIEGKMSLSKGSVSDIEKLPESAAEGDIYRVYNAEFTYYKKTGDGWTGQDSCPSEWKLLVPLKLMPGEPQKSDYPYPELLYKKDVELFDSNRNPVYLKKTPYFCNNGGSIRDEYIGTGWGSVDVQFRERGFPDDMSEETKLSLTDEDGELCKYGYAKTWCSLDEWYALYDSEEKRILGMVKDAYARQYHNDINRKLDFLIKNMKSPLSADINGFYNGSSDDSESDEDSYDEDYGESVEEIIEENMVNLFQIAEEIGKINYVADMYGFYDSSDIRVIYYLEH